MEKIQNPENPERDLKKSVIEALKNNEQNAKELFLQWRISREAEVEILGTERASIRLLIESADIFMESGMYDEALENLNDARIYASQMHDAGLLSEIEQKIDDLQNRLEDSE